MATADDGPRRRGRRPLDRQAIIDAALELIDENGIDGLTMRNLGRRLGVDPMAVYGHFEDKAALFEAVVDHETTRLAAVPGPLPDDPTEIIVRVGLHYRTVLLDHPNLAPQVAGRPLPQEVRAGPVTLSLDLFRAAGVADEDIPRVANALTRFALGFVVREAAEVAYWAGVDDADQLRRARLAERVDELDLRAAAHNLDPDQTVLDFELGLRALLHGLGTHRSHLPA
jgi:TetR/AcrR family tetracycline transcriptional repressor